MDLKLERLDQGEKVAGVAALALLACMFLSWFNFGFTTWTAWEALHFIAPLLSISIFTTLGCAFATLSGRTLGDLPCGLLVFVFGCAAALLILFRLIDPVSLGGELSTSASVEAGAFLGFIAAIGIAVGGYMQTDGEAVQRLRRLLPSGAAAPPMSPPAAAPPPADPPAPPAPAEAPAPVTPPAPAEAPSPAAPPAPVEPPTAPLPPLEAPPVAAPPAKATPVAEPTPQAFCEHCGAPMRAEDRFCRRCGQQQLGSPA